MVEKLPSAITITAPNGLHGASIELPYPSVGATEQVLLTAVLAEGETELRNAAIEPEIIDLICILQKMGAIITVEPNRVIFIEGVKELRGYDHRAIFDRYEAASWASAALATGYTSSPPSTRRSARGEDSLRGVSPEGQAGHPSSSRATASVVSKPSPVSAA